MSQVLPQPPTPFVAERSLNRTRPLGRLMTIVVTSLSVLAVLGVLGWVGRKGLVKIAADWADQPFDAGDFANAARNYSFALSLDEQHLHSRVNRALAYRALNQKELAAADFAACAKTPPRTDAEFLVRAGCNLELNKAREALPDLNFALAAHPDNADGFALRARAQSLLKEWQLALADLNQAVALQPQSAEYALQRSELREHAGDLVGALEDIARAVQLQQNAPMQTALLRRARLLRQTNNLPAAAAAYDQVIALKTEDVAFAAIALQERAQVRFGLGLLDGALADVEAVLLVAPTDAALRLRARIFREMDKLDLALRDLNDLLGQNPDDVKLLRLRADVNRALGDVDAMQQDWLRVIMLEPNDAQTYVDLGVYAWKHDRTAEAFARLTRAIDLHTAGNAAEAIAYAARGRIALGWERMNDALRDFSQALLLKPDDVATLIVRGKTYDSQDQLVLAQADFDAAVKFEPNNAQASLARGRFWVRQNKLALALLDLHTAATLLADAPALRGQVLREQALVLEALGRLSDAQDILQQVRVLLPNDVAALKYLVKLLQQQNKLDEASGMLKELALLQNAQDFLATQFRAIGLLEKQGKVDEALAAYTNVLSQTTQPLQVQDQVAVYARMGKLQYGQKQFAGSLAAYEAALKIDPTQPDVFLGIGLNRRKLGATCGAARSFRIYLKLAPDAPQRDELLAWLRKHGAC